MNIVLDNTVEIVSPTEKNDIGMDLIEVVAQHSRDLQSYVSMWAEQEASLLVIIRRQLADEANTRDTGTGEAGLPLSLRTDVRGKEAMISSRAELSSHVDIGSARSTSWIRSLSPELDIEAYAAVMGMVEVSSKYAAKKSASEYVRQCIRSCK